MRKIQTEKAPKAVGPYSQGIVAGDWVFASGQIPIGPDGKLLQGPIEEQTRQVMVQLEAVLEAAGVGFADVVKATIFLSDMADYPKVNPVYGSFFHEPYPARETVCVKSLPLGSPIEISLVAARSGKA